MKLRDYQIKVVDDIKQAWNEGHQNVLAQLSTGGGKTVILGNIVSNFDEPSIVIAHRIEIVGQISLTLARHGIYHNIIAQKPAIRQIIALHIQEIGKSYYDIRAKDIVAGVDTLLRLEKSARWFDRIKLVVQDEAHHVLRENKWGTAASFFPQSRGLYLTATPCRADGKGLGAHADGVVNKMIIGPTMRSLIKEGFLTDYRIVSPPGKVDLSEVTLSASGDYSPPKLRDAVHKSQITGDIVQHYLKFAAGKLGLTFAVDIEAATEIAAEFKKQGVPAEVITGKTPELLRASIMRRFRAKEILQIVNVDLLGEGVDVPALEVVSMARPTQSYALFSQQFGRALRPMSGKKHALIIDHVGNIFRHGLPDNTARRWSLDRRERKARSAPLDVIPIRSCLNPECLAAYERTLSVCPICGLKPTPQSRGAPEYVDGDLTELDAETLAALRNEIDRIDGEAKIPRGLPVHAEIAIERRHQERKEAQSQLREAIAQYAGILRYTGKSDSEIYRLFYFKFQTDVATAQTLNKKDANELERRLNDEIRSATIE